MTPQTYYLIHVISLFLLTAFTFQAIGAADKGKNKGVMALTGILALAALVGGFGLMAKLEYEYNQGWVAVKIAAWLVLSLLAGFAYRKPGARGVLGFVGIVAVAAAVYMVYTKPF